MNYLRLAIADDHPVYLNGLEMILNQESEIQVVIKAGNGKELIRQLQKESVDIIVLDISMPYMNGMECLNVVREEFPTIKIIMLSMLDDQATIQRCMSLGASCFLSKTKAAEEILEAVRTVHVKGYFFTQRVSKVMHENYTQDTYSKSIPLETGAFLTVKDILIIQMICREMTSEDIAVHLNHSKRSIETYRNNIIKKIGCKNVVGIVTFAVKNRLIYC